MHLFMFFWDLKFLSSLLFVDGFKKNSLLSRFFVNLLTLKLLEEWALHEQTLCIHAYNHPPCKKISFYPFPREKDAFLQQRVKWKSFKMVFSLESCWLLSWCAPGLYAANIPVLAGTAEIKAFSG